MKTLVIFQDSVGANEEQVLFDGDLVEGLQITLDYVLELRTPDDNRVLHYSVLMIEDGVVYPGIGEVIGLIVRYITIH